MGPGFVMVVTVAAGIISVDMANIGTPAGGDLAPSVTGRYGNRLAGIQLHSLSRLELVGLFFFVRRWFNLTSAGTTTAAKRPTLRRCFTFFQGLCLQLAKCLNFLLWIDFTSTRNYLPSPIKLHGVLWSNSCSTADKVLSSGNVYMQCQSSFNLKFSSLQLAKYLKF
jgi:hypothetical protein